MDDNKKKIISQRIDRVVEALSKNRIGAFRVDTKEDAVKLVGSLLDEGDTVACGGSVTLVESGVLALLKSGHYRFIDRDTFQRCIEMTANSSYGRYLTRILDHRT